MAIPGFTPLEPVASQYKSGSNAPHTDMHDDAVDAINLLAEAIPTGLDDVEGFDTSNAGTIPGRKLLLWDDPNNKVILGPDADPGAGYVAIADLGTPNSAAKLDADGKLESDQIPDGIGGGTVQVQEATNPALTARSKLRIIGANDIEDLPGEDAVAIDVTKADVRIPRVQTDVALASQTTLQTISDLAHPVGNASTAEAWDFDLYLWLYSVTAAQIKAIINGPTGSTLQGLIWGPHTDMTGATVGSQFDITKFRYTTLDSPTNGAQQFGGFTSSGTPTPILVRAQGWITCPAGITGLLAPKAAQVNSNAALSKVAAGASKLIVSRIS